jgi:hypothetical protein
MILAFKDKHCGAGNCDRWCIKIKNFYSELKTKGGVESIRQPLTASSFRV